VKKVRHALTRLASNELTVLTLSLSEGGNTKYECGDLQ